MNLTLEIKKKKKFTHPVIFLILPLNYLASSLLILKIFFTHGLPQIAPSKSCILIFDSDKLSHKNSTFHYSNTKSLQGNASSTRILGSGYKWTVRGRPPPTGDDGNVLHLDPGDSQETWYLLKTIGLYTLNENFHSSKLLKKLFF